MALMLAELWPWQIQVLKCFGMVLVMEKSVQVPRYSKDIFRRE